MILSIYKINILYDKKIIWTYSITFYKGIQIFPVLEEFYTLWSNVSYMQHCCIFDTRDNKGYKILSYPSRSNVAFMQHRCISLTIYWMGIKWSIPRVLAQKQLIFIMKLSMTLINPYLVHKGLKEKFRKISCSNIKKLSMKDTN